MVRRDIIKDSFSRPAISFVLHAHQPLGYDRYRSWNQGIYERSYLSALILKDFIGARTPSDPPVGVSLNISGSVLLDLLAHQNDPTASDLIRGFREVNQNSIDSFGVTSFLMQGSIFHSIVPLLPEKSKRLQYSWSRQLHKRFFGTDPSGVWLPEQAFDHSALELIASGEEKGAWTVLPQWVAPDGTDTSMPYKVKLGAGGQELVFFLYDSELSSEISHRHNGWNLYKKIKGQNLNDKLSWVLAMDLETFGEHGMSEKERRDGPWLLNNLLYYQIPQDGYTSMPLQALPSPQDKGLAFSKVPLASSGSWSCLCKRNREDIERELSQNRRAAEYQPYLEQLPDSLDGLVRWCAPCGCTNGGNFEANLWKLPFKAGLTSALESLHEIYAHSTQSLLKEPDRSLEDYIQLKVSAIDDSFDSQQMHEYVWSHFSPGSFLNPSKVRAALLMMEGIYHMEAAQTSCATYWKHSTGIEPGYNLIHAANAMDLFRSALAEIAPGGEQGAELANARQKLDAALELSHPYAASTYRNALAGREHTEHTHIDKMMEKF